MRLFIVFMIAVSAIFTGCESKANKIHKAVLASDTIRLQTLLDEGAYPDSLDEIGATPLCYAAHHGDVETVKLLVQHGAEVGKACHINDDGNKVTWWPLYLAVERGNYANPEKHEAVAILLIDKGADVNLTDKGGFTLIHRAHFSERLTRLLVDKGADINTQNKMGETALHFAVRLGDEDAVQFLLELGIDVKLRNNNGETARDYASKKKKTKVLSIIDTFQGKTQE